MSDTNDVRDMQSVSENGAELIYRALFPDCMLICTQCGHPAKMHRARKSTWISVICDCQVGPRVTEKACYTDRETDFKKLIHNLNFDDSWERYKAVEALGLLGDKRAVPYLIPLLADEDTDVAGVAAESLGNLRDASAVPALIDALSNETYYVRYSAMLALEWIGDERAFPYFEQAKNILSDEDYDLLGGMFEEALKKKSFKRL